MKRATGWLAAVAACISLAMLTAHAQLNSLGRGGQDWTTSGADAQRTSWVRTDYAISPQTMREPGFQFLWKVKLDDRRAENHSFSSPVMLGAVRTYRGGKSLAFVSRSSNDVYVVDTDLENVFWKAHVDVSSDPPPKTAGCLNEPSASLSIPVNLSPLAAGRGPFAGPGRSGVAFHNYIGAPNQGYSPEIFGGRAGRGGGGAPGGGEGAAPGGAVAAGRGGGGFRPAPPMIYFLSTDGILHTLSSASDTETVKPRQFLPAGSDASGLIETEDTAYALTTAPCGGAPNAVWALDLRRPDALPVSWKTDGGSIVGNSGVAFGGDGTIYAAIGNATGSASTGYSDAIVALAPKTLAIKDWFTQPGAEFSSTPTIFKYKGKDTVAAATKDGRVFLLDAASLGGADHKTPIFASPAYSNTKTAFAPGALASWIDGDGTTWVLMPFAGVGPAGLDANGKVTHGGIVALKVDGDSGSMTLTPAWVSRDLDLPLTPIVVNGVVFAVGVEDKGAGKIPEDVLYALDATTGKELWNSGKTITSFVLRRQGYSGGLSESPGQVYLTTYDGTLYTFGMPGLREQE